MQRKTVLSGRLVKSRAALQGISLVTLNDKAGFGTNYINRLWDKDKVTLESVNKIANVLGCSACDLLEETVQEYVASQQDAIWAYMVAAEWLYDGQPMQPSYHTVEETKPGVWHIPNDERDERGRFLPPLAVCSYNYKTGLWTIKMADGEVVKVRPAGEAMVVVEEEQAQ